MKLVYADILNVFIGSIKEVNVEQGSPRSPLTGDCLPGFVAPEVSINITYPAPSQLLTVRSLLCIAQQGPHVLVFQVYSLLSLKLQWLRLRRLRRRPPVRWFQPPFIRRLCQLHSLLLRRSPRLVQRCRRIFTPRACSLRPFSRPEWHPRRWLLPYQQWPFPFNVNPDQRHLFSQGTFRKPLWFRRPRWVHMLVRRQIFLQYPSGLLQLQDFSLTVPPFLQDKPNKLSFQVRHLCFLVTTRSPVPVAFFRGRLPPGMCSLARRRFQLRISPLLLWVRASLLWLPK